MHARSAWSSSAAGAPKSAINYGTTTLAFIVCRTTCFEWQ
jgi:hypothetical protein